MKLEVDNLGFDYPGVPVLDSVTFDLRPGEVAAVVSENGAGKSTLLKCMNRILKCGRGRVLLGGRDLAGMAYLPQKTTYLYPVTVFDVVLTGRYPHLAAGAGGRNEAAAWEVLEGLGLNDIALRDFNEISGGQQQQAIIARALAQEADILLLDEPTGGLDIRHQIEVMERIRTTVRGKGLSAAISLHDLNLASRYADRVIMLHEGSILAAGDPLSVFTPSNIALVYRVKASIAQDGGRPVIVPVSTL